MSLAAYLWEVSHATPRVVRSHSAPPPSHPAHHPRLVGSRTITQTTAIGLGLHRRMHVTGCYCVKPLQAGSLWQPLAASCMHARTPACATACMAVNRHADGAHLSPGTDCCLLLLTTCLVSGLRRYMHADGAGWGAAGKSGNRGAGRDGQKPRPGLISIPATQPHGYIHMRSRGQGKQQHLPPRPMPGL